MSEQTNQKAAFEALADAWEKRASDLQARATKTQPRSTIGAAQVGLADGALRCAKELRDAIRGVFPPEVMRDLAVERALDAIAEAKQEADRG